MVIIFFLQGCGLYKTMEMSAVPSPNQREEYKETITSQKKHFVSLAPYRQYNPANGNTAFILFVKNCGESPVDISVSNVSATFFENAPKWTTRDLRVLSKDDLLNVLANEHMANRTGEIEAVKELVLQSRTLQPGEGGGGLVVCATRAMGSEVEGDFLLVVSIDGEQHEFTFNRSFER